MLPVATMERVVGMSRWGVGMSNGAWGQVVRAVLPVVEMFWVGSSGCTVEETDMSRRESEIDSD